MSDRVKVRNVTTYDIGLATMNGFGYNIKPGLFVLMSRDDVEYNMALAPSMFEPPARLVVEDEELSMQVGITDTQHATYTDAELEKVLKGSAQKLKAFLEENREHDHIMERIIQMAQKADLPGSKLKIFQDMFPQREFID